MIGAKASPLARFEAALGSIDFAEGNAEMERLKAEQSTLLAKAEEAEAEARRLDAEIRDWSGPDSDAIADAILGGQSPGEAAQAARSREGLIEQRNALRTTAETLRNRAEAARIQRDQVAHRQCMDIAEAAEQYIAAQAEAQAAAADQILTAGAALIAIKTMTGAYLPGEQPSERARKAVTGADSLLGWRDQIAVPADLVEVLRRLEGRAKGLRSAVPETVANY